MKDNLVSNLKRLSSTSKMQYLVDKRDSCLGTMYLKAFKIQKNSMNTCRYSWTGKRQQSLM